MKDTTLFFIIICLFILLSAVWILPQIVEWINREEAHFIISGFQDMAQQQDVAQPPSSPPSSTTFPVSPFFRSGVCNGIPCPEGTFCDDVSQTCISLNAKGEVPDTGYFS